MAASEASKEAVYLRRFATELGIEEDRPPSLSVDNQAARDLAFNPEHHERTKHIDRRHFYIRELVENHTITVPFVCTADNLADLFTKPLAAPAFEALRDAVMNIPYGRAASIRLRRADPKRCRSQGVVALADGGVLRGDAAIVPLGCHWVSSC